MVVAVDFKDLDGLVGGAGLKELSFVSRAQGGGGGGGGGVDVRRDVCRSSPERSHAGGGQSVRVAVEVEGELTIMSSWRFDSCVYRWPSRQRSKANKARRAAQRDAEARGRTILKMGELLWTRGRIGGGVCSRRMWVGWFGDTCLLRRRSLSACTAVTRHYYLCYLYYLHYLHSHGGNLTCIQRSR